jgi:hypothetical protein
MYACGRWTYAGHYRELGACSCMAVHQAVEYASSCRLADGRGNCGDCRVAVTGGIHTLTLDELWLFDNWDRSGWNIRHSISTRKGCVISQVGMAALVVHCLE